MIQNPQVQIGLGCSFSSQRSIPTNCSLTSQPDLKKCGINQHTCPNLEDNLENQSECQGAKIIMWLKNKGIEAGFPEDLLRGHREEQKREIVEKVGRKSSKDLVISSTLLSRRSKRSVEVTAY